MGISASKKIEFFVPTCRPIRLAKVNLSSIVAKMLKNGETSDIKRMPVKLVQGVNI